MHLTSSLKIGIIISAVAKGVLIMVLWNVESGRSAHSQPMYISMNRDVPSFQKTANRLVHMNIEDTVHYGISEPTADAEWAELIPNGGLVQANNETYTITLFHQLRCLDIIRKALRDRMTSHPGDLERHCVNYLRQTLTCSSDVHMEILGGPLHRTRAIQDSFACNDWERAYNSFN